MNRKIIALLGAILLMTAVACRRTETQTTETIVSETMSSTTETTMTTDTTVTDTMTATIAIPEPPTGPPDTAGTP